MQLVSQDNSIFPSQREREREIERDRQSDRDRGKKKQHNHLKNFLETTDLKKTLNVCHIHPYISDGPQANLFTALA